MAASSSSAVCVHCDSGGPIVFDPDTSTHVCTSCGIQHSSDPFQNQIFSNDGVRHYSLLPTTGDPLYQELKAYRAKTLISTLTSRLGLSVSRSDDVLSLVSHLTSASFAVSESFLSILTAASAYVVARRNGIPISLPEAADAAGCEERQITRMLSRVLRFLDGEYDGGGGGESSSHLPHFDTASALSRTFKTLPVFSSSRLDSNKIEQMASTGQFLIRCAGKWFLSTGRRPMPLVAAVAAFVAEINGVEVPLEEIAKGIHAVVSTSRLRLRELKEALVRVAKNLLPWGKDVDSKNLMQNAPLLIRLMQVKASRSESADKPVASTEDFLEFDLDGTFDMYSGSEEVGCNYYKVKAVGEEGLEGRSWDELKAIKFSEVSFSNAYKNVLERIDGLRESGGLRSNGERTKKKRRDEGLEADAWMGSCAGSWDSDKNLTLKEILERDVGYDALPPSFVNGIESRARRKEKIIAAKVRINQTMNPRVKSDSGPRVEEEECLLKPVGPRKRKMRKQKGVGANGIDWEDCIIELLLLHQVDEEEIEQEGKSVQEMVDEALKLVPNSDGDRNIDQVNQIRESLALMGGNNTAFSLPQPHLERTKLCDLKDNDLDPTYVEKRERLKQLVTSIIRPKIVQGKALNGKEFVTFLEQILEALNKGEIPTTGSLVEVFNKVILERCLKLYNQKMGKVHLPAEENSLQEAHDKSESEARKLFDEQHFGRHHAGESILKLDDEIQKVYKNFRMANEYQSSKLCEALYTKCEDKMDQLQVLRLPSMAKFNAGFLQCNQSFAEECVGPSKINYEQRMSKMLGKARSLFIKEYNHRLFNWLVAFSLVMVVVGRFIIKFILLEIGAWIMFIFLETYTRMFWSAESLYYNPGWHFIVSSWETIVYSPLLDLDRWAIPIGVLLLVLLLYWRCYGRRKHGSLSLLPLYSSSHKGGSSRARSD